MSLRVAYIAVWVIMGLIALCSEEGFLPVEYLSHDPNTDYVVGVVSFLTAIGGTYLALRLLAFKAFVRKLTSADDAHAAWAVYKNGVSHAWPSLLLLCGSMFRSTMLRRMPTPLNIVFSSS